MKLDLLIKLKCESSNIIVFVGIRYSMRDLYFLTSITMPDPRTGDMRQIQ